MATISGYKEICAAVGARGPTNGVDAVLDCYMCPWRGGQCSLARSTFQEQKHTGAFVHLQLVTDEVQQSACDTKSEPHPS